MKKIIFIICVVVLIKPIVPVFQYIANYDYIATVLCENKETPIMACNGKCYLMKELAKASESEKPISSDKKHTVVETTDLFFREILVFNLPTAPLMAKSTANNVYNNLYSKLSVAAVFHPPASVS